MNINNANPITISTLLAIQGGQIPQQPSRSSKSELEGVNAFNAPFAGGTRSASFVNALGDSLGDLNEAAMRKLASDLALQYN